MTKLQYLNLDGCENITNVGLVHLKGMTTLQSLTLYGCENITDSSVAELQKALPNCRIEH